MSGINDTGRDWLISQVEGLPDHIVHVKPSGFNEENRYLPESVTSIPGYIRYDVNPFMREIVDCADINSPVREVNLKKGVQITYSTLLESVVLYYAAHVKTLPMMYMTADKELAAARIENNFIPMFNQSGFDDIIRSSDEGNTRKTGKTANHLQFAGGAYLVPFGAINAAKMRSYSIAVMLKDEIDAWPETVGKDGDPDKLSDGRLKGYWDRRKIFRGSTPLIASTSKIQKAYLRGDQRKYMVNCLGCGHSQELRWSTEDKETGVVGGFMWEMDDGTLDLDSVRYCCSACGHAHYERDKERLFSEGHGAKWVPTAKPAEPGIRSYHLPAMYSPIGMAPWSSLVSDYLEAYDVEGRRVKDITAYQVFYNNVLAEPFEVMGSKIRFSSVSAHRRAVYRLGQIPNRYAVQHSGSPVLLLTCQVDVHAKNLAVSVMGWCRDTKPYVIDYWRFEVKEGEPGCDEAGSPVWGRLRELIEETEYTADDGTRYRIALTLIDAGYANDVVTSFCADYNSGVYPILGRDRPGKNQAIKEFSSFETQAGTVGYKIVVDHYKDRLAPVLRREWAPESGVQKQYHFNAPVDITDKQLKELTAETRREKTDDKGQTVYYWHRPGNARNELWDLLVYGHAGIDILAWSICRQHFELDTINWPQFWDYIESNALYFEK
jgi:phage terminase large subunit GpA-like protein